jgi:hypothetical protein
MNASKMVHALVKYPHNPMANHFRIISIKNMAVKKLLRYIRIFFKSSLLSKFLSSKARVILEANIKANMSHSKEGWPTIATAPDLIEFHAVHSKLLRNLF